MKKSFSLLITILLITIFSFLSIFIIETKSISINNLNNLYLQSQTKLHLNFFKDYIKSLDLKNDCTKKITIVDEIYTFEADLNYQNSCQEKNNIITVETFLGAKTEQNEIKLHESFIINY